MSKFTYFLLLLLPCVFSCDPMRRINMKNATGSDVTITFKIKEDSIHKSPFYLSSDKEQKFLLEKGKKNNDIRLSAGIGTWTPKHLRSVVDDLEALEIKWDKGEIKLESEEDIFNYLLQRRQGLGKDKIVIRVAEPLPG